MEPILVCGHVKIEDIAILKRSLVGNSVTDDLIDRGAATSREVVVVAGRRVRTSIDDKIVHNCVDLLSCYAYRDCSVTSIEGLSCDFANCSQLD